MTNLNDLPLVAEALQNMCPVKIEPKVTEPAAAWSKHGLDYSDPVDPPSREDALAWRERELGDIKSKFDREDSAL